jgi:transposase
MNKKVTFREYNQKQMVLPSSIITLIPENHIVRVVNDIIDSLDISALIEKYQGGGRSAYNPKMLLKVLVYAYTQKVYSGRNIAKQLKENIYYMWIAGHEKPDFRTINRFRSEKLEDEIDNIFSKILLLLMEKEYIKYENYFLDGTKIEANARKFSFVWTKSTNRYSEALQEKIKKLLSEIKEITKDENDKYGIKDLEEYEGKEITSEELSQISESINLEIKNNKEIDKKVKKSKKILDDDFIPRAKKYEEYKEIAGNRNSFSKTDHDATFMRMKEDYMKNGHLKAGYNVQIGTENQFILGYSIHQKPSDTTTLIPHLTNLETLVGKLPKNIIADAGYGSHENYSYLEENDLGIYVKYNTWFQDIKGKKTKFWNKNSFIYDKENDEYICPNGERLTYRFTKEQITDNNYLQEIRYYKYDNCYDCMLKNKCTRGKFSRTLGVNMPLEEHKRIARVNLCSEEGTKLRKRRCADVEAVFGLIKGNGAFRRFLLRGIKKVNIEWGLISIAHNLKRLSEMIISHVHFSNNLKIA